MVRLIPRGVLLKDGRDFLPSVPGGVSVAEARRGTIAHGILAAHDTAGGGGVLRLRFDALASHDITYVGILLTARAAGLERLDIPYVLTNCHNSLCAVGGTINEDDHLFGLSAAQRYGAIYVPAHQAVIHAYLRETLAGCGRMILGSDSHTRYGALGTLGVGEGGPELVKQILGRTYDIPSPEVVAVRLTGRPRPGVGPHDVALALIGAVYGSGFAKNKILEFVGDGIASLPIEYRNGIDVMTTETACLSSVWMTDGETERYLRIHGRPGDYRPLSPAPLAYYDGAVEIDLSSVEPMIALPFHPSNVLTVRELNANAGDILRDCERRGTEQLGLKDGMLRLTDKVDPVTGRVRATQGVIAGCAGGIFDNLCAAADILRGGSIGNGPFSLSVYPASQPCFVRLLETGDAADLLRAGVTVRSAFCGPCFGAGDVPSDGGLSLRHTTRNFPHREGSRPGEGQMASVALMDARSIAATARNGGLLTGADETDTEYRPREYRFDPTIYEKRVYNGFGRPDPSRDLAFGPNIADWPSMKPLADSLAVCVCSVIDDPVTTTDELIPSGETSSYRSNPRRLSRFALSRKDPLYVDRADIVRAVAEGSSADAADPDLLDRAEDALNAALSAAGLSRQSTGIGSAVCAVCPGDGSAREQAASCQRVLGGAANIAREYATKRYRSNLINWGMLPLLSEDISFGRNKASAEKAENGDWVLLPGVRKAIASGAEILSGYLYHTAERRLSLHTFRLGPLTEEERKILLAGSLTGYYREQKGKE